MNYKQALTHTVFETISKSAQELNLDCYVIGGFVRDLILNRGSHKDIDIVAIGSGIKLAKQVAKNLPSRPKVQIFKTYGTAMLQFDGIEVEFVGARKESYSEDSRNPIVENGTLEDDQNRRDFTINALALDLNPNNYGELLDPFNGIQDLEHKIIRTPLNPDITYSDDPLRMLRAIRFATQLNFTIEKKSYNSIKKNSVRLGIISQERITEELNKIILSKTPSIGFKLLFNTELLIEIFREFCPARHTFPYPLKLTPSIVILPESIILKGLFTSGLFDL